MLFAIILYPVSIAIFLVYTFPVNVETPETFNCVPFIEPKEAAVTTPETLTSPWTVSLLVTFVVPIPTPVVLIVTALTAAFDNPTCSNVPDVLIPKTSNRCSAANNLILSGPETPSAISLPLNSNNSDLSPIPE